MLKASSNHDGVHGGAHESLVARAAEPVPTSADHDCGAESICEVGRREAEDVNTG